MYQIMLNKRCCCRHSLPSLVDPHTHTHHSMRVDLTAFTACESLAIDRCCCCCTQCTDIPHCTPWIHHAAHLRVLCAASTNASKMHWTG